jgi:iron complex transport system substrate-binding protein
MRGRGLRACVPTSPTPVTPAAAFTLAIVHVASASAWAWALPSTLLHAPAAVLARTLAATLAATFALALALPACALQVVDDRGVRLDLQGPAQRIVSLSPHITELLYAAGAGDRIVGTVAYSDYPAAAQRLPRVGDIRVLDLERIIALRPDLVIVWLTGSPQSQLDVLTALDLPIYYNEPRTLDEIGSTLERLGALAGTPEPAQAAAQAFRGRLAALRERYRGRDEVTVFHQIWEQPLMTVNGEHLISQVLQLCGGRNVFAQLRPLAAQVGVEAVLEADPEVIGAGGMGSPSEAGLATWLAWPQLRAVARRNFYVVDPSLISQHAPRILDGAEQICSQLDAARARRPARR